MINIKNKDKGICYLIGAGPGDPGLLTQKAAKCLSRATIVFYDYLASKELLNLTSSSAKLVYVGKSAGNHTMPQEEITRRVVKAVAKGEIVARLKGGDPFVFGRGGEEAIALKEAKLAFEIIPGVTSGIAAATYAGIPVTHRAISTMVTFVTGHETPDKSEIQTDWDALGKAGGTICIYMGVKNLPAICEKLINSGRSKDEAVAVIHRGTSNKQKTVIGTLSNISKEIKKAAITPPAIIIIGEVVNLRDKISWFEDKPLFGKRVLVTRAREQASELTKQLESYGAEVIEIPIIAVSPVEYQASEITEKAIKTGLVKIAYMRETNPTLLSMIQDKPMNLDFPDFSYLITECDELTRGIALLVSNKHDWVVFTSANGVKYTFDRIKKLGLDSRIFVGKEIAAIGSPTAQALENHGIKADLIPKEFTGESLLGSLIEREVQGQKILMLRASNARVMLREKLIKLGCEVDDITAYLVEKATLTQENKEILESGAYDIATFASSGTVRNFAEMTGTSLQAILKSDKQPKFVSIGPVTSKTMDELFIPITAEAEQATINDLVDATVKICNNE